jgi:succinate dehydrogenase / fumarate reductase membrane anchor subunit
MDNAIAAPASHGATEHWWHQRLTGGANLALLLWFVASIALLPARDMATLTSWIQQPVYVAIPLLLLIGTTAYHFRLGLRVAIEDYTSGASRAALSVLINYFTIAIATWAAFSILKLALAAA